MQDGNIQRVLTLVADPLTPETVDTVARTLTDLGTQDVELSWLAPGRACDVGFRCEATSELGRAEALVASLDDRGCDLMAPDQRIDWALQDPAERSRRLLVADMESTVIHNEMLDELADAIGRRQDMAAITAQAMNDEIDFEEALRRRVGWLADLPEEALHLAAQSIVVDEGAPVLVATLKALGVRTVLASGGFTFFAEPIAQRLGFDACSANVLDIEDGKLTGGVVPPILDREAKVDILRRHCRELGIETGQVVAVGDGANDLPMLRLAGLGVAYHGKPKVAAEAPVNIRYGKLDTLLFYLGIPQSQWHVP